MNKNNDAMNALIRRRAGRALKTEPAALTSQAGPSAPPPGHAGSGAVGGIPRLRLTMNDLIRWAARRWRYDG